jgi:hypothetical protein
MKLTTSVLAALALITLAQAAQAQTRVIVTPRAYSPFYQTVDPYTGDRLAIYRPNYLVPSNDFEGGRYAGAYAVNRAIGKCVIDLGYGRYEHC